MSSEHGLERPLSGEFNENPGGSVVSDAFVYLSSAPECEPPYDAQPHRVSRSSPRPPRPRRSPVRQAPASRSPHTGVSPRPVHAPHTADEVRRRAEYAIRLALEVLDLRRSPRQLRPLLTDPMIDVVQAHSRALAARSRSGTATLRRLRVQLQGTGTAEIFGTYSRGTRTFAYAARMERRRVHTGCAPAWTITQLQLV